MAPSRPMTKNSSKVNIPFKSPLKRSPSGEPKSDSPEKKKNLGSKLGEPDVSLALTLRDLRRDIDALAQAAAILSSSSSAKEQPSLEEETHRYLVAARSAAEELLPLTRQKLRDQGQEPVGMSQMLGMLGIDPATLGWVEDEDGEGHWGI